MESYINCNWSSVLFDKGRTSPANSLRKRLARVPAVSEEASNRAGQGFGPPPSLPRKSSTRTRKRKETKETAKGQAESKAKSHSQRKEKTAAPSGYGPRGLLLVGFSEEDAKAVEAWLAAMEPGFKVSCCTDELLGRPLEDAVTADDGSFCHQSEWQKPKELVPRAALFSGLSNEEAMGIAQFWDASGVRKPIFASAVDAAKHKPLRAVLLDVAQAYAASNAPPEEKLDAESLRMLLRERMAAKGSGTSQGSSTRGPIVIRSDGATNSST